MYLEKLLSVSSNPIITAHSDFHWIDNYKIETPLKNELITLLNKHNGFLAFESALFIYPTNSNENICGLKEWNCNHNWLKSYNHDSSKYILFGADLFSVQFVLSNNGIETFNPETGELTFVSETIEGWAKAILEDYDFLTGWSVAHKWQTANYALPIGDRLIPKTPFTLGGEFIAEEMLQINIIEAMQKNVQLYLQCKDLPDGTKITLENWV